MVREAQLQTHSSAFLSTQPSLSPWDSSDLIYLCSQLCQFPFTDRHGAYVVRPQRQGLCGRSSPCGIVLGLRNDGARPVHFKLRENADRSTYRGGGDLRRAQRSVFRISLPGSDA